MIQLPSVLKGLPHLKTCTNASQAPFLRRHLQLEGEVSILACSRCSSCFTWFSLFVVPLIFLFDSSKPAEASLALQEVI